jgi:hypothetical protein
VAYIEVGDLQMEDVQVEYMRLSRPLSIVEGECRATETTFAASRSRRVLPSSLFVSY